MLKKIWRLFLGLMVLTGSACVTPTHASSATVGVVLTHIQAGRPGNAKAEMVALYNNSPHYADITGWCIENKSATPFACFISDDASSGYILPAYSSAIVVTDVFLVDFTLDPQFATVVFPVTHQQSGSIVNSADVITLYDANGVVQDSFSWDTDDLTAIPAGQIALRKKSPLDVRLYETLTLESPWVYDIITEVPIDQTVRYPLDANDEEDEPSPEPPINPDTNADDGAGEPGENHIHPRITELLPDATGGDIGSEFIELYNASEQTIILDNYRLRTGAALEKSYKFPAGSMIPPFSYAAFTNDQVKFRLNNTSSKVQLEYQGRLVGDEISYQQPVEGWSWALVESEWLYTDRLTPGAENQASTSQPPRADASKKNTSTRKPCAANQYRHPVTNRCRLIALSTTSGPKPCKSNQVRNPETNRCRLIASATKTLQPCKEGQERNPETNRCRNIVKMTKADYAVKGVTTEKTATNWYVWLGIAGVAGAVGTYAVWEWRAELHAAYKKIRKLIKQKFARSK